MGTVSKRFAIVGSLVLVAGLLRLVPHPPNFSPMVAAGLLSGAYLGRRLGAFLVPAFAWLVTDGLLELLTGQGFHRNMPAVYLSLLLVVLVGSLLQQTPKARRLALASVASSTIFYLVTNFSVWATGSFYPHNGGGLVACYVAALPFYGLSLLGDLSFTALLFVASWGLAKHILQPVKA